MRDTYQAHDLPQDDLGKSIVKPVSGMRHSIRPRHALAKRDLDELDEAPVIAPANAPLMLKKAYIAAPQAPRWQDLKFAVPGEKRARTAAMPVVDSHRDSPTVRAFDLLRTRLRQTTQEHGWRNIAVVSPTKGCGNTFTAVNLALSLSRVPGSRTVLMDMNLRNPGVAKAFDMQAPGNMHDLLAGKMPLQQHLQLVSDTLALGMGDAADENAAETLQDPNTADTLEKMRAALRPELVIYDMPAMLAYDDVSAFLPQLDGILLVSDGTRTMAKQLRECERMLDGQVPLLGMVLNRARANSVPSYR